MVKHAQATRVDVILHRRGDRVRAVVEDDGIGFDPIVAAKKGRLGLLGMRGRAESVGGALTVESAIGSGTTVVVEAPYAHSCSDRG